MHEAFNRGQTDAAVLAGTSISNARLRSRDRAKTVNAVNSNLSTTATEGLARNRTGSIRTVTPVPAPTSVVGQSWTGAPAQADRQRGASGAPALAGPPRAAQTRQRLGRCQIRYKANDAIWLFVAGSYHDVIFNMSRLVINANGTESQRVRRSAPLRKLGSSWCRITQSQKELGACADAP